MNLPKPSSDEVRDVAENVAVNVAEGIAVKVAENIVESIVEKLSTMRGRIVKIVWKNPYASAQSISEEVGIAPRNVQEHLRKLQTQGIICRIGPDKVGHWEIFNGK